MNDPTDRHQPLIANARNFADNLDKKVVVKGSVGGWLPLVDLVTARWYIQQLCYFLERQDRQLDSVEGVVLDARQWLLDGEHAWAAVRLLDALALVE